MSKVLQLVAAIAGLAIALLAIALLAIARLVSKSKSDPVPSTSGTEWREAFIYAALLVLFITVGLPAVGWIGFHMTASEGLKAAGGAILIPAATVVLVAWARRTEWPSPEEGLKALALVSVACGTATTQAPDMFVKDAVADWTFGLITAVLTVVGVFCAARLSDDVVTAVMLDE
jgi:hypothetical protein